MRFYTSLVSEKKMKSDEGWIGDPEGNTAIWITGRNKEMKIVDKDTKKGCTWVLLTGKLVIVSCYYSPRKELDAAFPRYVEGVDRVSTNSRARHHIVAGDFNASAAEWGSNETESRGVEIIE